LRSTDPKKEKTKTSQRKEEGGEAVEKSRKPRRKKIEIGTIEKMVVVVWKMEQDL
jgi:hypothetical protein